MLPLVYLLGAGAAYLMISKKGASTLLPAAGSNPASAQPSNQYPFRPTVPPRVDNKNQPWVSAGTMSILPNPPNSAGNIAGDLKAGGSVVHSLSDIWGDLFPKGDDATLDADEQAKLNLDATDSMPNGDYDAEYMTGSWDGSSDSVSNSSDQYDATQEYSLGVDTDLGDYGGGYDA